MSKLSTYQILILLQYIFLHTAQLTTAIFKCFLADVAGVLRLRQCSARSCVEQLRPLLAKRLELSDRATEG